MKPLGKILNAARMFLNGASAVDLSRAESPVSTVASDMSKPRPLSNGAEKVWFLVLRQSIVFWFAGLLACNAIAAASNRLGFVVQGTVEHQQFGPQPFHKKYEFKARSAGCSWSMSSAEFSTPPINAVQAVGNPEGVFIIFDLKEELERAQLQGRANPKNTFEAMVLTNTVPNTTLAPQISAVWFAFLSTCFLEKADPLRMPVPIALNIAGGSSLPPFVVYYQSCILVSNKTTGLPNYFASIDEDGHLRGFIRNKMVRAETYPPSYNKGFTNLIYRVIEHSDFMGLQLPKLATFEVYWISIPENRLELIHRLTLKANRFDESPRMPIPPPTLNGVTIVADGRLGFSNSPVIVPYAASNRFLSAEELEHAPGYKQAIAASIGNLESSAKSATTRSGTRRVFLLIFILALILVVRAGIRNNQNKNEKINT